MDKENAVVAAYRSKSRTIGTAESCTGGLLSKRLTEVPGSSEVFMGGVVSYTNHVKKKLLGVSPEVLDRYGAVSPQTAEEMAVGARAAVDADVGIGITGLAGPDGDGSGRPVGLVYIGLSTQCETISREFHLTGTRTEIRQQASEEALSMLLLAINCD